MLIFANRQVKVSAQCPLCERGVEDDTKHMLFQCPRARMIWRHLGLDDVIDKASKIDRAGQAVLEYLLCDVHHSSTYKNAWANRYTQARSDYLLVLVMGETASSSW